MFQFTHPGGVRPPFSVSAVVTTSVSIHAPGRGATQGRAMGGAEEMFQFTHPGGVRRSQTARWHKPYKVSIHAPGRGATAMQVNR